MIRSMCCGQEKEREQNEQKEKSRHVEMTERILKYHAQWHMAKLKPSNDQKFSNSPKFYPSNYQLDLYTVIGFYL